MPIYEYACSACEDRFEMLQPVGAAPPDACPVCGAPDVRRLVSVTSFVLKGSGWYRDGYGLNPSTKVPEPSSAPSSPAPSAETKAAAK
jgi:putative FmdB family regulatory protein